MTEHTDAKRHATDIGMKALYFLTIFMVIVGLVNATPGFPGYDALVSNIVGISGFTLRKFPYEWFYPLFFALMMLIVSLKHSMWRTWSDKSFVATAIWAVYGYCPCHHGLCNFRYLSDRK